MRYFFVIVTLLFCPLFKSMAQIEDFKYDVDRFADIQVLRYQVPGFENLSLKQKKYVYYLTEAALNGRDILFDQNYEHNLLIRNLCEAIYINFLGDKADKDFKSFEKYLKQIWFANGIHHHYSMDKFKPDFSKSFLSNQLKNLEKKGYRFSTEAKELVLKIIFDANYKNKRVNQNSNEDIVITSACNLYSGVTQKEVENYYNSIKVPNDTTPISYGLNARVTKKDGKVTEEVYKVGGLYDSQIQKIVYWLNKAKEVAENELQKQYIGKLIEYYETGNLRKFDEYSILWVQDTHSIVDFINGFIESYGDPLGMTGSWESIVNFKNIEASNRTQIISDNAQWFEDNSPIDKKFKKDTVTGVSAKVITAAILAGDSYPSTPIGINLPNADWIRASHGSKSVSIENITDAYDAVASNNGFNDEFAYSSVETELLKKYLSIADKLHTDLHECLGHGSGQLLPGVDPNALLEHGSTLEETRADLFALYYLADPKLIELGIFNNPDTYKAEYYKYIMNGLLTQNMRIELGKDIEEAHMRNRKLISEWAYQKGKKDNVIEYVKRNNKTFIKINDYSKLRELFGQLLTEVQRIKSEGDYAAGKNLVEKYGIKIDRNIHQEILDRNAKLNIAPYKGFVNPVYTPVYNDLGEIIDINISYDEDYVSQMLRYSNEYSQCNNTQKFQK